MLEKCRGAIIIFKYKWAAGESRKKGTWHTATVHVYKKPSPSTTNKHATLIQEVGHSLSLAHCLHSGINHIMHQGLKNFTTISSYDKQVLNLKWGGNS